MATDPGSGALHDGDWNSSANLVHIPLLGIIPAGYHRIKSSIRSLRIDPMKTRSNSPKMPEPSRLRCAATR